MIDGPAVRFATASAAQQWLDDNADVLFAQRIAWVNLLNGEHVIDGPRLLR